MSFPTFLYGGLSLLWFLDALRLRGRMSKVASLPESTEPPSPAHRFIVRPGVELDEPTRRAASAWARQQGLQALDVIPADISARRSLFLLQLVDFAHFRKAPLAKAYSAGAAMLVHEDLIERMGEEGATPTDTLGFFRLAHRVKQYAPEGLDYAVAPTVHAAPEHLGDERELVRAAIDDIAFPIVFLQLFLALLGPWLVGPGGWMALAMIQSQGWIATLGTALHPRDLWVNAFLRVPMDIAGLMGIGASGRAGGDQRLALRSSYSEALAAGTPRFFEAKRAECPLCGKPNLEPHIEVRDLFQDKPGTFDLERCRDCGLIFQNPRLSIEGLGFYYRDFYDGLGEARLEGIFVSTSEPYEARARAVTAAMPETPNRWLDVGTGHGHFCLVARGIWASTRFEGLDLSEAVVEAERRGWVARAHQGLFPDLADGLAAHPYDVVSMSHYLEHTRDPRAELAAAAKVISPGGVLLIELPHPESKFGKLLGRYWMPWFQPQHQYLLSPALLEGLLKEEGFEPKACEFGSAHLPVDLVSAVYLRLQALVPAPGMPWMPPSTFLPSFLHRVVWVMAMPVVLVARVLDLVLQPLTRNRAWSNAFRVVSVRVGQRTDSSAPSSSGNDSHSASEEAT